MNDSRAYRVSPASVRRAGPHAPPARERARRLRIRGPIVPVPVWLCRALAAVLGVVQKRPLLKTDTIIGVTTDADVDIEPARRAI